MKKKILISIGVLVLVVLAGSVFAVQKRAKAPADQVMKQNSQKMESNYENTIDTSSFNTYKNFAYGFEIKYPKNFKVTEGRVTGNMPSDGGLAITPSITSELNRDLAFNVAIFKSKDVPKIWYKEKINDLDSVTNFKGESKEVEINGYSGYFVNEITDSYTDKNYVISNGNVILFFHFRELAYTYSDPKNNQIKNEEYSLASYFLEFEAIVKSLRFLE